MGPTEKRNPSSQATQANSPTVSSLGLGQTSLAECENASVCRTDARIVSIPFVDLVPLMKRSAAENVEHIGAE